MQYRSSGSLGLAIDRFKAGQYSSTIILHKRNSDSISMIGLTLALADSIIRAGMLSKEIVAAGYLDWSNINANIIPVRGKVK